MDKLFEIDYDRYIITKNGEIISKSFNHFNQHLGYTDDNGYVSVSLRCKNGKSKSFLFHRVIWFYFNGEIPEGLEINHKDEDKSNNSLDNLELLTRADNIRYGTRAKRAGISNSIAQKGKTLSETHIANLRKASANKRKPVLQYNLETNEPIKEWCSTREIERELGLSSSTIGKAARGIYSQAYGYGWKYI